MTRYTARMLIQRQYLCPVCSYKWTSDSTVITPDNCTLCGLTCEPDATSIQGQDDKPLGENVPPKSPLH